MKKYMIDAGFGDCGCLSELQGYIMEFPDDSTDKENSKKIIEFIDNWRRKEAEMWECVHKITESE